MRTLQEAMASPFATTRARGGSQNRPFVGKLRGTYSWRADALSSLSFRFLVLSSLSPSFPCPAWERAGWRSAWGPEDGPEGGASFFGLAVMPDSRPSLVSAIQPKPLPAKCVGAANRIRPVPNQADFAWSPIYIKGESTQTTHKPEKYCPS